MVDYKKAALWGAVGGAVASFVFGRKTRTIDYGKIAKYAAGGAGVVMAAGYVMAETGKPIGLLATRTGHYDYPIGHEHFHSW